MANIAFIPVRGGSKSIPLKNIKLLLNKPMVYWSASAANNASCIDKVVIATDSDKIKRTVLNFKLDKIEVYDRKEENATDTATTESVMLEYIESAKLNKEDNFFLIQATSPMITSEDIDKMWEKYQKEKADSIFSCVVSKRFYWNWDIKPVNYDYKNRPRRQDYKGMLLENGACYINKAGNILKDKNRLSGKITFYEMPEYTAFEIDEEDDFIIIEKLMEKHKFK